MSHPAGPATTPAMDGLLLGRLLVRPKPREGEHRGGHWLRVAHANGLREPRWLLDSVANRPQTMVRVCPLCLCETDGFWHSAWLDGHKPWCELHRVWLVDRCESCGRALRWSHVGFHRCGCGSDLRDAGTRPLPSAVESAMSQAPVSVLLWLGALSKHGLAGKPLKRASRRTLGEATELIERGAGLVGNWPKAFFGMLDHHRLGAGTTGEGSLHLVNDALPGLRKRIGKLRDSDWRSAVDSALGEYVGASLRTLAPLVGRNAPDSRPPSVMKMARELRVRPERLSAALDQLPDGGVTRRKTAGGRCRRIATPEALATAKALLAARITMQQAARMLALTPARVRQLVADHRLPMMGGKLDRDAVLALRMTMTCRAIGDGPPVDAVTFEHALRYWIPVDRTGLLIDALRSGALTVHVERPADRGQTLMLSLGQVREWSATQPNDGRGWLTIPEVASQLALKQEVVYHLVRVGLLASESVRAARRTAGVVTRAALCDFEARFEPLVRAATRAGISRRRGLEWAKAGGVSLVSGPQIDGGRQYFVEVVPR